MARTNAGKRNEGLPRSHGGVSRQAPLVAGLDNAKLKVFDDYSGNLAKIAQRGQGRSGGRYRARRQDRLRTSIGDDPRDASRRPTRAGRGKVIVSKSTTDVPEAQEV